MWIPLPAAPTMTNGMLAIERFQLEMLSSAPPGFSARSRNMSATTVPF